MGATFDVIRECGVGAACVSALTPAPFRLGPLVLPNSRFLVLFCEFRTSGLDHPFANGDVGDLPRLSVSGCIYNIHRRGKRCLNALGGLEKRKYYKRRYSIYAPPTKGPNRIVADVRHRPLSHPRVFGLELVGFDAIGAFSGAEVPRLGPKRTVSSSTGRSWPAPIARNLSLAIGVVGQCVDFASRLGGFRRGRIGGGGRCIISLKQGAYSKPVI